MYAYSIKTVIYMCVRLVQTKKSPNCKNGDSKNIFGILEQGTFEPYMAQVLLFFAYLFMYLSMCLKKYVHF